MTDTSVRRTSKPLPARQAAPEWGRACLTRQLQRLADHPSDRRRAVVAAALDLGGVVAGGHLDHGLARDSLLSSALRLYDHEPGRLRELERTITDCLRRGERKPKYPPPLLESGRPAVAEQLLAWESVARSRAWSGRAGASRLALLLAMYQTASKVGRLTLSESLRELCDMAGHSSHSVTDRAVADLQRAGWLRRLERGTRQATHGRSVWELLTPPAVSPDSSAAAFGLTEPVDTSEQSTSVTGWLDPAHDCWHQRQTAWRLACWLAEHPGSGIGAMARALGLHRSTVRRQLRWLVAELLVVETIIGGRECSTFSVVAAADLAAAHSAESWPVSPAQRRQERWRRDRESWRLWLQELARQREQDRLRRAWERSGAPELSVPPHSSAADLLCMYDSATGSSAQPVATAPGAESAVS
jgi:DNA-binding transcriptional ArsR family regulator